jgi:hypothetical protein
MNQAEVTPRYLPPLRSISVRVESTMVLEFLHVFGLKIRTRVVSGVPLTVESTVEQAQQPADDAKAHTSNAGLDHRFICPDVGVEGNWRCTGITFLNETCGNVNFGKRPTCNRCGADKPADAPDYGGDFTGVKPSF